VCTRRVAGRIGEIAGSLFPRRPARNTVVMSDRFEKPAADIHEVLERLVGRARRGHGGALVISGGPGAGKTRALAEIRSLTGFRTLEIRGNGSETVLPLAGLHRLLAPLTEEIARLPPHQAEPLGRLAGHHEGAVPDELTLYTAVQRLLVEAATVVEPVLCCIDDAHGVDRTSLAALAFAARRLDTEPVLLLFTVSPDLSGAVADDALAGLPRLRLGPLDDRAARRVLAEHCPHRIPEDLVAELVDQAAGNPLALVELAGALTPEQVAGQAPGPEVLPSDSRLREHHLRLFRRLSADARKVVLLSVADDRLERSGVVQASALAGIDLGALEEATASGLVHVDGERVNVAGPLVRSSLCAGVALSERHAAHELLARTLDPRRHRLRWTRHRAATADAPSERLADELEVAAAQARKLGDYAASAHAYRQAATLTAGPADQSRRLVAAATDSWLAGRTRESRVLLRKARTGSQSSELRGLADLLHGEIELRDGLPAVGQRTLLDAADALAQAHHTLAVTALMRAGEASCFAGDYQAYFAVARRAADLRRDREPPLTQLMFDHFAGLSAAFQGRHGEAAEPLRRVVEQADRLPYAAPKIWASLAALVLGDDLRAYDLATQAVRAARDASTPVLVPSALQFLAHAALALDRYPLAVAGSQEGLREARETGQQNSAVHHLAMLALLSALQGDTETARLRLVEVTEEATRRELSLAGSLGVWTMACLDLADDRPAEAMERLRLMATGTGHHSPAVVVLATPHFIEAAVRCGQRAPAGAALTVFDRWTATTGSPARQALSQRCHALLAEDATEADEHFREALRLHSGGTSFEYGKTALFYARRLRRDRKLRLARDQLRTASKIFEQYDAACWRDRARAELRAAGDVVEPAAPRSIDGLTPQQTEVARLVADGATNREIAAQLFLSHRTVDHHLRNIFVRLGIRSRVELGTLFAAARPPADVELPQT
jgi:DNA-binding CsgD family transcriptional regulator